MHSATSSDSASLPGKVIPIAPSPRRYTLLIVDDEDGPRQSLRVIFKDDYNILMASNGPEALDLFDVYAGPPVPSGHRNLAYRLRLRDRDRTLTADEAEEIIQRVRIGLEEKVGVQLRE